MNEETRQFLTLAPEDISRFLIRHRRGGTLERYEPRIDQFLKEILARTNEFVLSESGAILLDDPRAKRSADRENNLTVIAAFGETGTQILGQTLPCDRGVAGRVYTGGKVTSATGDEDRRLFEALAPELTLRSLLGVPIFLGASNCGLILLINRLDSDDFSQHDHTLITIFAGYISSSIQNTLDGIRAKELAQRDDLTGLYNDRYIHYRLRSEIQRADAERRDLSLVFIDLDRFKAINDKYGHLEGSRTIHVIGSLLENEIPDDAIVARYGGDEFVVMLPDTGSPRARIIADRLRRQIAGAPLRANHPAAAADPKFTIQGSFGVASLHEHVPGDDNYTQRAYSLIQVADEAMYRAKANGGNCVMVGHEGEE